MINGLEVGLVRGCESWLHDTESCALEYIGFPRRRPAVIRSRWTRGLTHTRACYHCFTINI
jgi:hypothetical protein